MVGGFTSTSVPDTTASAVFSDDGTAASTVGYQSEVSVGTQTSNGISVYVNGIKISEGIQVNNTTYVLMRTFFDAIGEQTNIAWDIETNTATVTAAGLVLTATVGEKYMTANGRCFYLPEGVINEGGSIALPVSELAKLYQLDAKWDEATSSYSICADNPRVLASSGSVYNEKDLYWLSHLINAEAGNQSMKGKIAVGDVVINRLADPDCPKTVYNVIFDDKFGVQFSVTTTGGIYKTPNEESVVAAKICLEGYNVVGDAIYFVNPKLANDNWFSKTRTYVATIGEHVFYS